jgi:PAS domain S-box-containing protein
MMGALRQLGSAGMGRWAVLVAALLAALILWLPIPVRADDMVRSDVLHVEPGTGRLPFAGWMAVLRDEGGVLTIDEAARSDGFRPLSDMLVAGFDRAAFWLRIRLANDSVQTISRLLEIGVPFLDHVDVYQSVRGGFLQTSMGDRRPFTERPVRHRSFVVPVELPAGEVTTIYLRIASTGSISAFATLWAERSFAESASVEAIFLGGLHGIMLILILSALVQFVLMRERVYGLLALFGSCFELAFLGNNGYTSQFLFPSAPLLADGSVGVAGGLTLASGAVLSATLLRLREHHPRVYVSYLVITAFGLVTALTPLLDLYRLVGGALQVVAVYLCFSQVIITSIGTLRGDREMGLYLAAFGTILVAYTLFALRNLGLIESESVDFAPQVGSVFQMILLNVGPIRRVLDADRRRRQAERALLEQAIDMQAELELQVKRRTNELSAEVVERRLAEKQIIDRERQLKEILDTAPFPMIIVTRPESEIMFTNRPGQALLGHDPEHAPRHFLPKYFQPPGEFQNFIADLKRDGVVIGRDVQINHWDGSSRYLLTSAVQLRYQGRDAVMLCLNDITSRKALEEELIRAREHSDQALELQRLAMREQRNFLTMVSHEFKTPLAVICAAVDVIEVHTTVADERAAKEIGKVRKAVYRLTGMIDSMLAEDWLDSSLPGTAKEPVDLLRLLEDLGRELEPLAGGSLSISLPAGPVMVDGSRHLLRVLFSNLVENGFKYSGDGSNVRLQARCDGGEALVRVIDNGPGVPRGEGERIFDKFIRLPEAGSRIGVGLGLYLVRHIASFHGGSVTLSNPGRPGADFLVKLPLSRP